MERSDKFIEDRLKAMKPPFSEGSFEKAKHNVFAKTTQHEKVITLKQTKPYPMAWLGAAASIVILLSLVVGVYFSGNKEIISNGESFSHVLPDGSTVKLSSESKIIYNDLLWSFSRKVTLHGEGFFKVAKGERFQVITRQGVISVLGTQFSVWEKENALIVHCSEGRVEVEGTVVDMNKFVILDASTQRLGDWQTPEGLFSIEQESLSFENTPLDIIVELLESKFDQEIQLKSNEPHRFSGNLDPTSLDNSLQILSKPFGLKIELDKSRVVILEP